MKHKKNIGAIVALLAVLSLSSCKKEFECHCEKKSGGEEHIEIKTTKGKAKSECSMLAETADSVYEECYLE